MTFYAGFDTRNYPGIDAMNWLHTNSNLSWCGYYLAPAPNRSPTGWQGQYNSLKDQWGVLPIFVGQQDPNTGHGAYVPSSILTADQGLIDGKSAADLAVADQFPAGSFVYLDWESGSLGDAAKAYICAWINAVVEDGRLQPGIYCAHGIAAKIAAWVNAINPTPNVRLWCWFVTEANYVAHPFAGDLTEIPTIDPAGCGFPGAVAWQREQNATVTFPDGAGITPTTMDFSTSSLANPGG